MTKSIITANNHISDVSMFPEMDVRAADACGANVNETFVGSDGGDVGFHETEVVLGARVDGEVLGVEGVHFEGGVWTEDKRG